VLALAALALIAGLAVGSFLNVVIHRVPRHESVVSPRSRCPGCGKQIRGLDNIPIVSWLVLRGRCRDCGEPISPRYPLVEALTGLLYAAVVISQDAGETTWIGLALATALVPIAFIDLDHKIIPNVIVGPAAVVGIALVAILQTDALVENLIAGVAAAAVFLLVALARPGGMGMGDVKLVGMLGLYLGRAVVPALFIALAVGSVVGIGIMASRGAGEGRKTKVPFGPFLALGGMTAFFVGDEIVDWYLDSFT
jgi:leader peptidase (prepilin peptidase) / N-methyltransferase